MIPPRQLPQKQQEGLETVVGLLAVAMVTYMILWMKRHARGMRGSFEASRLDRAGHGSISALVAMAFLAVMREGLETAMFLLAAFQASANATTSWRAPCSGVLLMPAIWAAASTAAACASTWGASSASLALVLVRGRCRPDGDGLVHTAHEAGWLNSFQAQALDLTWLVKPGTVISALLTGMLGIQPRPAWIEVIAWLAYLVPMPIVVAWPARRRPRAPAAMPVAPAAGQ